MDRPQVRVFIVDRYRLVRDGLRARLASEPFLIVGEAANLADAVMSVRSVRADVVITDIGPDEVGDSRLDEVVRDIAPAALLVAGWSAVPTVVARAMKAGARGFILKDAPSNQLLDAVSTVASGGTCIGAGIAGGLFRGAAPDAELSRREREVLKLVGQGLQSKHIAAQLNLSLRTVESHRQNIKRKLQLKTHAAFMKYAVEHTQHDGDGAEAESQLPLPSLPGQIQLRRGREKGTRH